MMRNRRLKPCFQELLRLWRLTWDFLTIVLVAIDAFVLPIRLAWPERFADGGYVQSFYQANAQRVTGTTPSGPHVPPLWAFCFFERIP